jgi:peroxiredoxin
VAARVRSYRPPIRVPDLVYRILAFATDTIRYRCVLSRHRNRTTGSAFGAAMDPGAVAGMLSRRT